MSWLDWVIDVLGSREWMLAMLLLIVVGAFMVNDYQLGVRDEKPNDNKPPR